jgi:hypothetical protein
MVSHAHGQGYSDLNFLIPELVSRIGYRKGPYFASEGDFASAGSARISLLDDLPGGLAQVTLGQNDYRRALLAGSRSFGVFDLLGALELAGHDGPWQVPADQHKVNALVRATQRDGNGERSLTFMAYNSRWTATDQIAQRAVDAGTLDRFGSLDPTDGGRTQRVSLSAQQRTSTADGGESRVSVYAITSRLNLFSNFTYLLDDPTNGDQFEQAERRRVFGAEASRRWSLAPGGYDSLLTVGAQLRHDRLSPVGLHLTTQRQRLSTTQESAVRQTQLGLYGELATTWTPWLRSVAGLRADGYRAKVTSSIPENSGSSRDWLASPKLSLIFGPWRQTELFVNAGAGFHSNDARGTVARISPREGTPIDSVPPLSKSRGAELGVRTEIVRGLQSSLALWRLDLDSELVFVGDAGDTEASRPSRREGIEWNTHWALDALGWKSWLLDLDLATSRARFKEDAPEGNRVPGAVGRVASFGLTYAPEGRWFGHFQLRYFGPRDLTEDGSQRSRSTTLAYLRLGFRPTKDSRLALDVFNLFDRKANDIEYFYASRLAGEDTAGIEDRHFHPVEPRTVRLTFSVNWQ